MSTMEITPAHEVIALESVNAKGRWMSHARRPYSMWREMFIDAHNIIDCEDPGYRVELWMIYGEERVMVWSGVAT